MRTRIPSTGPRSSPPATGGNRQQSRELCVGAVRSESQFERLVRKLTTATVVHNQALFWAEIGDLSRSTDAVHPADVSLLDGQRVQAQSTHPFYGATVVATGDWR